MRYEEATAALRALGAYCFAEFESETSQAHIEEWLFRSDKLASGIYVIVLPQDKAIVATWLADQTPEGIHNALRDAAVK